MQACSLVFHDNVLWSLWFRLTPYRRHARISTYTASGLYHKGAPYRSSTNASTWHCDSSSHVGWRPPYSGIMHQQPCCFAVSFANHVQWSVRRIQISAPRAREGCDVRLERRAPQSGRAFRIRLRFCSSVVSHGLIGARSRPRSHVDTLPFELVRLHTGTSRSGSLLDDDVRLLSPLFIVAENLPQRRVYK